MCLQDVLHIYYSPITGISHKDNLSIRKGLIELEKIDLPYLEDLVERCEIERPIIE
jgi:hypothetical protein